MKTALSLNFKQTLTYLAIKIEQVKRRGFDTYKTKEKKEEHKEKTVFTASGDDGVEYIEEGEGVPVITH